MLPASDSISCARLSTVFAGWRSWSMSALPCWLRRAAQAATQSLGLEIATLEIRRARDIVPAFESLKDHADALYVTTDALLNANRLRINTLALGARLPSIHEFREFVEAKGLMSYGPNLASMF